MVMTVPGLWLHRWRDAGLLKITFSSSLRNNLLGWQLLSSVVIVLTVDMSCLIVSLCSHKLCQQEMCHCVDTSCVILLAYFINSCVTGLNYVGSVN